MGWIQTGDRWGSFSRNEKERHVNDRLTYSVLEELVPKVQKEQLVFQVMRDNGEHAFRQQHPNWWWRSVHISQN